MNMPQGLLDVMNDVLTEEHKARARAERRNTRKRGS